MSILTADYAEIINERRLKSEAARKERPTAGFRRLKWREIEDIKDDKEIELLESDDYIQIG